MELEELAPADYNPREDLQPGDPDYERIKNSLDRFGMVLPYVWNERTENLVYGHQRRKIQLADGVEEVEVSVVDLPLEREQALSLALNGAVEGRWDEGRLTDVIEAIEHEDPATFDELGIGYLLGELDGGMEVDEDGTVSLADIGADEEGPPEMELQPFEHYDYVVIMADDERDWKRLLDLLEVEPVEPPPYTGSKKVGLGRAIWARDFLELVNALRRGEA